jgi:hypothetical protein
MSPEDMNDMSHTDDNVLARVAHFTCSNPKSSCDYNRALCGVNLVEQPQLSRFEHMIVYGSSEHSVGRDQNGKYVRIPFSITPYSCIMCLAYETCPTCGETFIWPVDRKKW